MTSTTTSEKLNDFGFIDESEIVHTDKRMERLESLIMPLLKRLASSEGDIKWPNRKEPLEKLMKDILEITRS